MANYLKTLITDKDQGKVDIASSKFVLNEENARLKHEIKMVEEMLHSQEDLFMLEKFYNTWGMMRQTLNKIKAIIGNLDQRIIEARELEEISQDSLP
ncbi:hypothetical protein HAX54_038654 [Datura stramonium]|uniref:Uncharacterized protein n=1 Tax=Datura stramonium TaxID=4076 RepID=A0ABS8SI81_DATST|nr:hypothetical protein [Datura stramonium]